MIAAIPVEYARICDLMDAYFGAVREYNRGLGAYDMTPDMIRDARRREALNYAKVKRLKEKLAELGIPV